MRFAVDVPEVRDKLACGEVSLSTIATLQKFVRNEKKYKSEIYTPDQKKELFAVAVGKSRRETEAELARISPQSVPKREEIRPISASENKMTLIITDELLKKIERLKQVLPEGHGNAIADIIDKSVSIALRKFDPLLKRETKECKKPQQPNPKPQTENPTSSNETRDRKRPYIPVSIIKELHITNQSRCSFISRTTGKRCNETHSLQIEHIVPFAKGGTSHRTNLTLLCSAHQRVRALEEYGERKMNQYFART